MTSTAPATVGRYLIPVVVVALWELVYLLVGQPAMASPWMSASVLFNNLGPWLSDIAATLFALLVSFVIAALAGVILGFAIGLSRFWSDVLSPMIIIIYSIPKVTLYPIFLLVFGISFSGKVSFSVIHGIFPVIIICLETMRGLPAIYLKVARCFRLSFVKTAVYVLIPAVMRELVVGLRMCFSLCFIGLILAEMFAAYSGLGARLIKYTSLARPSYILALIIVIVVIAAVFTYAFVVWQERRERKTGAHDSVNVF